ncbi:mucin-16-like isoform X6 [Notamacropus eugenii]|uniref:mucin-16-like isoform X6 n=1 Tax=Notamacropus eugenii TaxID=9315 RepID=UPI003B6800FA
MECFTLDFTITNLLCKADMEQSGSRQFSATENILQSLVGAIFEKSCIAFHFSGCKLKSLRSVKKGTGVHLLCAYWNVPTIPVLDERRMYHDFRSQTCKITRLGPYTLDRKSLYINGYNYRVSLFSCVSCFPVTSRRPNPSSVCTAPDCRFEFFTLKFTITNLIYTCEMGQVGSSQFYGTESVLKFLLRCLMAKTSIASVYCGCRLTSLRPWKEATGTGVGVTCACWRDADSPILQKEQLYWELRNHTCNMTKLGSYMLDERSLFLDDDNYLTLDSTKNSMEPSLKCFTLKLTITSLRYLADMSCPNSIQFNIVDTMMQHLIGHSFKNTTFGSLYSACKVTELRPVKKGSQTAVDAICTCLPFASSTHLDAKQIFHELSNQTRGIRLLGHYSLDKDSLYINGYNEPGPDLPSVVPVRTSYPADTSLTPSQSSTSSASDNMTFLPIRFTITNLRYMEGMDDHSSGIFNNIQRMLRRVFKPLFGESSIASSYDGCQVVALRSLKGGSKTGVEVVCNFRGGPTNPSLDKYKAYWELSKQTEGISRLGPYIVEKESFYLDGCNEHHPLQLFTTVPDPNASSVPTFKEPSGPPSSRAGVNSLQPLPFNFIRTSLSYQDHMDHPGSAYLCSIKRTLQQLLNPFSSGSTLTSLRPMTCRSMTRVAVVCHCWQDPTTPFLIREKFSCELNYQTYGTTRLGVYILKNDILYLNAGVNSLQPLPFNFIRTSLSYQDHMDHPGSAYLCSIKRTLQQLLNPFSSGSTLTSLRPMTCRSMTRVAAVCHCWQDPTTPFLIREKFSCELNYQTYGTTRLGVYILKNDILYLNASGVATIATFPYSVGSTGPEAYTVSGTSSMESLVANFTVTNFICSEDMGQPSCDTFNSAENVMQHMIGLLFRETTIGPYFPECKVTSLRAMMNGFATRVDFLCTHRVVPVKPVVDSEVYWEMSRETHGITILCLFTLAKDSHYLDGYKEESMVQSTEVLWSPLMLPPWATGKKTSSIHPRAVALEGEGHSAMSNWVPICARPLTECALHQMPFVRVNWNCSFSSNLGSNSIGQGFLDGTRKTTGHCPRGLFKLDNLHMTTK